MRLIHDTFGRRPIEPAPFDEDLALLVTDGGSEPYEKYPCKLTASGWVSSSKGTPLAVTPSGSHTGSHGNNDRPTLPATLARRRHAGVLERDEARRMAVNFARLPELLGKADRG